MECRAFDSGPVHFKSGPFLGILIKSKGKSLLMICITTEVTNKLSLKKQSLLGGVKKEGAQIMHVSFKQNRKICGLA